MKALLYILLFVSLTASAQDGYSVEQLKTDISQLLMDLSVGNACDAELEVIDIASDLDMNLHTLELMKVHIIIQGQLFNEGAIIYACDNSILEVMGGTLSTPANDMAWLKVWPIPATDEINVTGINVTSLQLYDIYGRLLKEYKTFGQLHKILISDLASGIYFLRVNDAVTKKIVKQ